MSLAETINHRFVFRYEPILPPILFAVIISAANPWWSVWGQFNTDEGINLMKAVLVAKGFSLFSEIWTDQPPVLTFILAGAESFFPRNIIVSRGIILIFSGLLLWSLFRIVYRLEGRACAWLSSAALVAIEGYRDLSVSVMIGLPAVALAAAAMDQTIAAAVDQKKYRYWIAGILYAVSLQTKMFTSILFPVLVLAVFLDLSSGQLVPWRTRALNFTRLTLSTLASFLAIAAVSGEPIFAQLVAPHFQPGVASEFADMGGIQYMTNLLAEHIPFAVASLFIAGSWVCVRGWKTRYAIPILWLSSAGLVFSVHRPLFDHHLLVFYVPIAWLSSLSMHLFENVSLKTAIRTACILLLLTVGVWEVQQTLTRASAYADQSDSDGKDEWIFPTLLQSSSPEAWVLADNLLDAYFAGRLVPPELAVWSDKRMKGGYLSSETLISIVEKRQPEQILLRRFQYAPSFLLYLDQHYERVRSEQLPDETRYYVRATKSGDDHDQDRRRLANTPVLLSTPIDGAKPREHHGYYDGERGL